VDLTESVIHEKLAWILQDAEEAGYFVTVEQVSVPPLRMGGLKTVVSVRAKRSPGVPS
jgi:hypothetical protein